MYRYQICTIICTQFQRTYVAVLCVDRCRSFFGSFLGTLFFLRVLTQLFSRSIFKLDSKTEFSAFDTESCVRLIGEVTGTASRDGVRFENLMLAKDVTGQTGPSPIPRFGDGNKSEEKECKLL